MIAETVNLMLLPLRNCPTMLTNASSPEKWKSRIQGGGTGARALPNELYMDVLRHTLHAAMVRNNEPNSQTKNPGYGAQKRVKNSIA